MTPETTAAIANATGPVDTHTGPPYVPAPGVVEARREAAGIPAARPVKDLDPESDEAHVLHEQALAETIAELDRADAIGGHGRPQADNVAPANAREAVDEPLPVLLDRLAEATAEASALKAVADQLRPRVEAAAIRRYDEEGTDRYRRDLALVTLRFSADRVVVEDEAALRQLVEADLDTYRAEVTPGRERQLYDDLITVGGALLDNDAGAPTITLPAELAERLVEAVLVHRELDPARALAAVEDELGATVTKAGDVIADTGELVECLRVERGQPAGVQVRCDAELKARALADTRARLGLA